MNSITQFRSIEGAVLRYRIMAFTVGVGLLVLTFVGIPLQIFAHNKTVVDIVGPIHGYLYLVYLVFAYDLARRARFHLGRLILMISAGLVPFVAFIVEHQIMKSMRADADAFVRNRHKHVNSTPVDQFNEIETTKR